MGLLDYEAEERAPIRWAIMKHTQQRAGEDQFFIVENDVVDEAGLYRGEVDEMVERAVKAGVVIEADERD